MGAVTQVAVAAHRVDVVHDVVHIIPGARLRRSVATQRQRNELLQPSAVTGQVQGAAAVLHIDGVFDQSETVRIQAVLLEGLELSFVKRVLNIRHRCS